jgi:hypothetical protein
MMNRFQFRFNFAFNFNFWRYNMGEHAMHTKREHEVFKRVRRVHAALAVTEETLRARVEYARGTTWSTLPAGAYTRPLLSST